MPKIKKNNTTSVKPRKQVNEITCGFCGEVKKIAEYYVSYNPIHLTSRLPYCKQCLKNMSTNSKGNIELDGFKKMLKFIDRPFLYDIFKISMEDKAQTIGTYMKNIAMPQYREFGWVDSVFEPKHELEDSKGNILAKPENKIDFVLTDQIIDKWGFGYSDEEYYYFEKKWKKLIDNYGEKTSFHSEGLIIYIRFRVKEELATARGDVGEAKQWAAMAKDAATAAKINVSQLSKSDISGGVDLLPQLFEAVESKVGIISILPKLKEQPYDDADVIIWSVVNYLRRLEDKSRIEYRDIWNFYDQMLEEYFKQQGYSKEKIKTEKEKRNNIFRDLGKVYKEPIYEDGDL